MSAGATDPLYPQRALDEAKRFMGEEVIAGWGPRRLIEARWAIMVAFDRHGMAKRAIARRLAVEPKTVRYGIKQGEKKLGDPVFCEFVRIMEAA